MSIRAILSSIFLFSYAVRGQLTIPSVLKSLNEESIPYISVEEFAKRMKAAGNRCDLVPYKDQVHGFFNAGRGQGAKREAANRNYHRTLKQMDRFLESLGYLPDRS